MTPTMIAIMAAVLGGSAVLRFITQALRSRGEYGLGKEQMALQRKQLGVGTEAAEKAYKIQKGEKAETWERIAMESSKGREAGLASQQAAMVMAALQAMGGQGGGMSSGSPTSLVNILRGG